MTVGQRWRRRRDVAITALSGVGFSQRFLADVFDLPRSRVQAIIRDTTAGMEAERSETDPGPTPVRLRPDRRRKSGPPTAS